MKCRMKTGRGSGKGLRKWSRAAGQAERSHWNRKVGIGVSQLFWSLSEHIHPDGRAARKIRQYFEPEKIVEYEVEGSREDVDRLQQEIGYVVYYDQDDTRWWRMERRTGL